MHKQKRDKMDFIEEYCTELKLELQGSDPAVLMDATNAAYEYLSNEIDLNLSSDSQLSLGDAAARAVEKFGTPFEVAQSFLELEEQVSRAFSLDGSKAGLRKRGHRFFSIISDIRAYTSMLYMILSVVTGIIALIWIGYGLVISALSSIFIIGFPICILFFGSVRGLALIESRLIETLLGERMPRRPVFFKVEGNIWSRFIATLRDKNTWKSLIYMVLQFPVGIVYGIVTVLLLGTSVEFLIVPFLPEFTDVAAESVTHVGGKPGPWLFPITTTISFFLLLLQLHVSRFIGKWHARYAKFFLVEK